MIERQNENQLAHSNGAIAAKEHTWKSMVLERVDMVVVKMFKHQPFFQFQLERITRADGNRTYKLPSGMVVESVTTILKKHKDETGLNEWKKRVGEKEATRILRQAGNKGSSVHHLIEQHLLNNTSHGAMPFNLDLFNTIKPELDEHISSIYGIEHQLYSEYLKTAGTADILCQWDYKPTIVDIKTSIKRKKEEWIENYFIQASCYAMMATEHYDINFDDIVILMVADHEPKPLIFHKQVSEYKSLVERIFRGNGEK